MVELLVDGSAVVAAVGHIVHQWSVGKSRSHFICNMHDDSNQPMFSSRSIRNACNQAILDFRNVTNTSKRVVLLFHSHITNSSPLVSNKEERTTHYPQTWTWEFCTTSPTCNLFSPSHNRYDPSVRYACLSTYHSAIMPSQLSATFS